MPGLYRSPKNTCSAKSDDIMACMYIYSACVVTIFSLSTESPCN